MKKIIFIATFFLMSNIYGQSVKDYDSTLKTMFEVSGTEEAYKTVIKQLFIMFKKQYSNVPPEIWNELEMEFQHQSFNELAKLLSPVYSKYLTIEELEEVIKFYSSPAGIKLSKNTPLIMQESMQIGEEWGKTIGENFVERMKSKGYDKT